MAFFKGDISSQALKMDTSLNVILPHDRSEDNAAKTLYLLHGLSDNASAWQRFSSIERYANRYNIAVVIPEVQRSFYSDMVYGPDYFTYVADELPALCKRMFNLSDKREDTMVAGLSMGGYGALKVALNRPERFGYCGAFSSAVDMERRREWIEENQGSEFHAIFGMEFNVKDTDDLFKLVKELPNLEKPLPEIYMTCGTEDFLYEENIRFKDLASSLPYEFTFEEWSGEHEWGFWDLSIEKMLKHFLG